MLIKHCPQFAKDQGLKILVDAEYTYMNPGISAVALAMMVNFNTSSAVVGNTYQCYLKVSQFSCKLNEERSNLKKLLLHTKKCSIMVKIIRRIH